MRRFVAVLVLTFGLLSGWGAGSVAVAAQIAIADELGVVGLADMSSAVTIVVTADVDDPSLAAVPCASNADVAAYADDTPAGLRVEAGRTRTGAQALLLAATGETPFARAPASPVTDLAVGDDIVETSSHNARGELTTQSVTAGTVAPAEWSFLWDPTRPAATPLEMRLNDTLWARSNYGLEMVGMHFAGNGSADYYAFDIRRSILPSTSHNSGPSDYDAFGTPNQTMALQYGYRSEVQNFNEIHLRNRNYTPDNGTFTTPDPLDGIPGTPTETNPYHYTDNDPLNKTDPLGLSPSDDDFSVGECASSVTAIPGEWARGIDTLVTNPTQVLRGYRATVRDLEGLSRNTGLGAASRPTGEVLGALSTFFPGVRSGSDTIVSLFDGNYQAACESAVRTGVDIATVKIILKVTKTVGKRLTAPKALPRSGPIPRSLGAASGAEPLAKEVHLNVNSPTARQVLNSLDDSVAEFVGTYRKGSIWRELPGEVAEMSVEEALRYSPAVRKLLVDNRFVKR